VNPSLIVSDFAALHTVNGADMEKKWIIGLVAIIVVLLLIAVFFLFFQRNEQDYVNFESQFNIMYSDLSNEISYLSNDGDIQYVYINSSSRHIPCITIMMGFFNMRNCTAPSEIYYFESNMHRPPIGIVDLISVRGRPRIDALIRYESSRDAILALSEARDYLNQDIFTGIEEDREDYYEGSTLKGFYRKYRPEIPSDWPPLWPVIGFPTTYNITAIGSLVVVSGRNIGYDSFDDESDDAPEGCINDSECPGRSALRCPDNHQWYEEIAIGRCNTTNGLCYYDNANSTKQLSCSGECTFFGLKGKEVCGANANTCECQF
jgi:hypothetical protein